MKDDRLISLNAAINEIKAVFEWHDVVTEDRLIQHFKALPSAQPTDAEIQRMQDIEQAALEKAYECGKQDAMRWIPCKTALPEINQRVILSLTNGTVMTGYQGEPDILWQVKDKRKKIWVYDPKSYTNDIDGLPTTKDCWFEGCDSDGMSYLSVTSPNYRKRFPGVIAWCPLPEPYKEHPDADHN